MLHNIWYIGEVKEFKKFKKALRLSPNWIASRCEAHNVCYVHLRAPESWMIRGVSQAEGIFGRFKGLGIWESWSSTS